MRVVLQSVFLLRRQHHASRRITRCDSGTAALEFGMIAPVFFLLILGVIEFSTIMFVQSIMESSTVNASRLGKTGYVATGTSRSAQIRQEVLDRTVGLLDDEKLVIDTRTYSSPDKIGQEEPYTDTNHNGMHDAAEPYDDINANAQWDTDMGAAGLGDANDYVVYTVSYPWKIFTPIIGDLIGTAGKIMLSSRAVVKNEPYDNQ